MDASNFVSFSSFDNARGVEARLSGTFIDHFADLVAFETRRTCMLPEQANVTREWSQILSSVVLALEWKPFSSAPVVLVLLDDDEFGRGLKLFFSRQLASLVDFKFLLILVESCLDVMVYFGKQGGEIFHPRSDQDGTCLVYPLPPDILIKSRLFCFSFSLSSLLRDSSINVDYFGDAISLLPNARVLHVDPSKDGHASLCWNLLSCVRASVTPAPGGASRHAGMSLESTVPLEESVRNALFCLARIQVNVVSRNGCA